MKLKFILKIGIFVVLLLVVFVVLLSLIFNFSSLINKPVEPTPTVIPSSTPVPSSTVTPSPFPTVDPKTKEVKLLFVGDTMLARSIGDRIVTGEDPFVNVEVKFKEYDYVIANLETNISTNGNQNPNKLYTFNAPVESIDVLKNAGIKIVSLANNHVMDFGPSGLSNQLNLLNSKGIKFFGAGNSSKEAFIPLIVELPNKTKLGLIGVNNIETWFTNVGESTPGVANMDIDKVTASIQDARNQGASIVIIMPHWGYEYETNFAGDQQEWGRQFLDAGADLVIGNHPHVRQGVEVYKGKQIYYALGNFVFDVMDTYETSHGYMVEVEIVEGRIEKTSQIPIRLNEIGYPELDN